MHIRRFYLLIIACLAAVLLSAGGIVLAVWTLAAAAPTQPPDGSMPTQLADAPTIIGGCTIHRVPASSLLSNRPLLVERHHIPHHHPAG